jgi:uncharacterized protein YbjT (DUF2867 family)
MHVAVIGATGKTGGAAARALLARKHTVRAIVRDPGRAHDLAQRGAELFPCDLGDGAALRPALAGAEGVYFCSPLGAGHPEPFVLERSWAHHAIDSARAAGVRHFVFLSVQGPESAPGVELLECKRALERDLAACGVPYTILRANVFMDNPVAYARDELLAGRFSWPLAPSAVVQPIAVRDIGEIAARSLETGPRNRSLDLVGPEPLTLPQLIEVLGQALGRPIAYRELTDAEFVAHLGPFMGEPLAWAIAGMYRLLEREGAVGDAARLTAEFGVSLTSCHDYASRVWHEPPGAA